MACLISSLSLLGDVESDELGAAESAIQLKVIQAELVHRVIVGQWAKMAALSSHARSRRCQAQLTKVLVI
jgi:hypothetical protein